MALRVADSEVPESLVMCLVGLYTVLIDIFAGLLVTAGC